LDELSPKKENLKGDTIPACTKQPAPTKGGKGSKTSVKTLKREEAKSEKKQGSRAQQRRKRSAKGGNQRLHIREKTEKPSPLNELKGAKKKHRRIRLEVILALVYDFERRASLGQASIQPNFSDAKG